MIKSVSTHAACTGMNLDYVLPEINDLSINGLSQMFNVKDKLFCFSVRQNDGKLEQKGTSRRYTIISLLGLHKLESRGEQSPINVHSTMSALLDNAHTIDNIGDLGLLLWLCSLTVPEQLQQISSDLDIKSALNRYPDALQRRTMELAWFLTGLSYYAQISEKFSARVEDVARQTFNLLKENYGGKGIFGHMHRSASVTGKVRGRLGSFADQVYPIYALSIYANAYNNDESLTMAIECANTICRHQGPLGQWWWHYDAITGNVVGRYPVYAVHQDGMAPMSLFAISQASGKDFNKYIYKGLEWITGCNELDSNLIDTSRGLIWRCVHGNKYKTYYDEALSLLRLHKNVEYNDIKINYECRPYHLGWVLYAFADKSNMTQNII